MPYNMKATQLDPTELFFRVGEGNLTNLAGFDVYVTKDGISGWFGGGVAVRREEQKRLWTHGNFSLPGTRDGRVVSIEGVAWGATRRDASVLKDRLNGLLADGSIGKLTIADPDEGTRWARCFLAGSDVKWEHDDTLTFALDLVCPNPRRFGDPVEYTTGISELGGGLQFPLFGGGPYSVQRTNIATNPSGVSTTANYSAAAGTGGTATVAIQASGGKMGSSHYRQTWTVAGVGGGATYTQPATYPVSSAMSGSLWVRSSVAKSVALQLRFRNAGTAQTGSGTKTSSYVTLAANVWTELKVEGLFSVGPATDIQANVLVSTAVTNAVGQTLDVDGVLFEPSATLRGPYFDGSTANDPQYLYEWAGTDHASASTAAVIEGAAGVLDFGEPGRMGTITVTNYGTADTYPEFWIEGYTPAFTITELETGRRLEFMGLVPRFQTLYMNASNGAVYLDTPEANRLEGLGRDEWPVIPRESTRTYLFDSPEGPNAKLRLKAAPAWW